MRYFQHNKGHPMNTPNNQRSIHPVMVIAAVAVVLFCGVGSAAILGWLPTSNASGTVPGAAPMPGQLATTPEPQVASNNLAPARSQPEQSQGQAPEPAAKQAPATCSNCGVVESVRSIEHRPNGSGVGAAGGAILGGLLGNQVGSGHG